MGNSVVGSAIHYGWLKPQKEVEVGNDDQISLGHVHVEVGGGEGGHPAASRIVIKRIGLVGRGQWDERRRWTDPQKDVIE